MIDSLYIKFNKFNVELLQNLSSN